MSNKSNRTRRPAVAPPPVQLPRESNASRSMRVSPLLRGNQAPADPRSGAAPTPSLLKSNARFKFLGIRNTDSST